MSFNIRQLDKMEPDASRESENALEDYKNTLIEQFAAAPEGQIFDEEVGSWADFLMDFGFHYLGATIPKMTVEDVVEVVTSIFPRKVTIFSPEEAEETIPELIAFWEFLMRQYRLPHAEDILAFLRQIEPEFYDIMNDPSKFGMAKSMLMMGQQSGFDMHTEEGINRFFHQYNANILQHGPDAMPPLGPPEMILGSGLPGFGGMPFPLLGAGDWGFGDDSFPPDRKSSGDPAKKKQRRKMAKASRKKNRKKKK